MSYDNEWLQETLENRRKAVSETIRPATLEELRELGAQRFPSATDPWYESYNAVLNDHPNAKFYRAETPEGAQIVYCHTTGQGVWFLPAHGMGILQPKGLKFLAELVNAI